MAGLLYIVMSIISYNINYVPKSGVSNNAVPYKSRIQKISRYEELKTLQELSVFMKPYKPYNKTEDEDLI